MSSPFPTSPTPQPAAQGGPLPGGAPPPTPGAAPAPGLTPPVDALPPPPDVYGYTGEALPEEVRTRPRPPGLALTEEERDAVYQRVIAFADEADAARADDLDSRIQLHAKFMQWASERDHPWAGAHPVSSPDIMTAVLRTEDTLQNAVMSQSPIMNAAASNESDKERERAVDRYMHYQFRKQMGEKFIESTTCDFVREGDCVAYVHWVRETRRTHQLRTFSPIPAGSSPRDYFTGILTKRWPGLKQRIATDDERTWTWRVSESAPDALNPKWYDVEFYTRPPTDPQGPGVEMTISSDLLTFNSWLAERVPYERLLYPPDCDNLQAPSPSNPTGAPYVILVDYPTLAEVRALVADGTYDLITLAEVDEHVPEGKGGSTGSPGRRAPILDDAKLDMRRFDPDARRPRHDARNQGCVTRLRCYDLWARDDGAGESLDVIWTVIEDMQRVVRARHIGEEMPGNPPRRPFAEGCMVPIPGQRSGLGLPYIMEQSHDWEVKVKEQLVDGCDIAIVPAFAYRQSSSINPLEYRLAPGLGMPESQPNDIRPLALGTNVLPVGLNQLAIIKQDREGLVSIGDLQLGRIPAGKSSALRTSSGIQQVLAQGEARPERLLRRYFLFLQQVWSLAYQLNRHYVDVEDTVRTIGAQKPDESPWLTVKREDFSGTMEFDFVANVLNTGRLQLQEALEKALGVLLNPLAIQLGIVTPDTVYRALSDWLSALGQTPEKYLQPPTPAAAQPFLLAADALAQVLQGQVPQGAPGEGSIEAHLGVFQQLLAMPVDNLGTPMQAKLAPQQLQAASQYISQLQQQAAQLAQQQALAAAAPSLADGVGGPGGKPGRPPEGGTQPRPGTGQVGENELMDESLPGSGTPQ